MNRSFILTTTVCLLRVCPLFSQEILVFYHIPKCGGTTAASVVGQHFDVAETYHQKRIQPQKSVLEYHSSRGPHLLELDCIDLEKVKYIHGHQAFSDKTNLPEAKNFTILRDPIERVFSSYRYTNQHRKMEFFEFYRERSNLQVLRFSTLSKEDPGISLKEHLESAKHTLSKKFFFVGIAEEMESSLKVLYRLMNWEPITLIPKFNITAKSNSHDPELYSFVFKEEWADRELYEFAKALFTKYLEKTQALTVTPKTTDPVDTIRFSVDHPLDGEGWGYREMDLGTNTALRQSYTQDAFIRFPLLKRDYVLKFKASFPSREAAKHFQLLVNGNKINCKHSSKGNWRKFKAKIPEKYIKEGKTVITFHTSDLYIPSEHQNVSDHRKLGIGISKIFIKPFP